MTTDDVRWRDLALQFDRHRIEALSMLRGVAAGTVTAEDCERFLAARPPISSSAEELLRQRNDFLEKAAAENAQLKIGHRVMNELLDENAKALRELKEKLR